MDIPPTHTSPTSSAIGTQHTMTENTPLLVGSSSGQDYTSTAIAVQRQTGKRREYACHCHGSIDCKEVKKSRSRSPASYNQSRSRSRNPPDPVLTPEEFMSWTEESRPGAMSFPIDHSAAVATAGPCAGPSISTSHRSWWEENVSVTLENSGSVARDHLASERTFLAYMRTSLTIASAGVALVQLFSAASASIPPKGNQGTHRLHAYVRPLGAGAVVIGLAVLFIGVVRYYTVQAALVKGSFPVARLATAFIATMLAALVTLTFGILLAGKLEAQRP